METEAISAGPQVDPAPIPGQAAGGSLKRDSVSSVQVAVTSMAALGPAAGVALILRSSSHTSSRWSWSCC